MIILLSPAKTLDFESPNKVNDFTQPDFLKDSQVLVNKLKKEKPAKIKKLMGISEQLAQLNYDRFNSWKTPFNLKNARQAILAFKGDVYRGLEAETFNKTQLDFAQKHLRLLSGLYGLLRPLDLIQPYRLEMGTKYAVDAKTKNLYAFWEKKIAKKLEEEFKTLKSNTIINLASNEYFKAVNTKLIDANIITPEFKDFKNGQYKSIMTYAKLGRGYMTNYIIKNKIKKVEDLKGFDSEGYSFNKKLSTDTNLIFTRG